MRKAAPKHRTRRKGFPPNSSSANLSSVSLSGSFDEDEGFVEEEGYSQIYVEPAIENNNNADNRKELINEADEKALIVKNYRLAKELSDLKTKHREEAKAVTRLTMENVSDSSYTLIKNQQVLISLMLCAFDFRSLT